MRKKLPALALLAISSLIFTHQLFAQQDMDNAAVIKLLKAGLSDDLIVTTIDASPGKYDTSADALTALRNAGADSKVISAVLMKSAPGAPPAPAAPIKLPDAPEKTAGPAWKPPPGVDGEGIYFETRDENWKPVLPESVTKKAGGVVKSVATEGKIKGDVNAIVMGSSSQLALTLPASFILYTPDGGTAGEYLLLRFHSHLKNREFRLEKGGEFHRSNSEARDTVDFSTKQLGPRVYEITLGPELGAGEYGFLTPNDARDLGSDAGYGKMYTFSVMK